jgi:hypothetical protein
VYEALATHWKPEIFTFPDMGLCVGNVVWYLYWGAFWGFEAVIKDLLSGLNFGGDLEA